MRTKKTYQTDTQLVLDVIADSSELQIIKQLVLERFAKDRVNVQGFRPGKAPLALIEKQIQPQKLQADFLDQAINQLYVNAIENEQLRPVEQPEISVKKFVPYDVLEFEAKVEVVGAIKLGDYKNITLSKPPMKVVAKDINDVIISLQKRVAEKKDVLRASKEGDEIWIDFSGSDATTHKPVNGADGKDHPIIIGSNTFIPGFEPNLLGLKTAEEKTFTVAFPKDYGVKTLQNKKVEFRVKVNKVQEVIMPPVDNAFAAKVGPFKTLDELKADIKKQIINERQQEAERVFENELIAKITNLSQVAIPKILVEEQLDQAEQEERQNLTYRGQTWQEHLTEEGVTEKEHRDRNRKLAEERVKAGLVLSKIAELEKIVITPEAFEIRIQMLKGQYPDKLMQAEFDKDENRRDILSRMLTEKTLEKLKQFTTIKN